MTKPKHAKIDCDDLLSRHGAGLLADAINAYWRERGYSVQAERFELRGCKAWGVRSGLVNGLPQAIRTAQAGAMLRGFVKSIADKRAEFLG